MNRQTHRLGNFEKGQLLFESDVFARKLQFAKTTLDGGEQLLQLEWFDQKVVGAAFQRLGGIFDRRITGHEHNYCVGIGFQRRFEHFHAGVAAHHQVGQDQVEL